VNPVYEVKGDVNLETGNIVFLGTVIVHGSVEDQFSVKASGNIEIKGSVGKAMLEAEGDVIIKQGVMGKDEAKIKAGGSVIAKFLEHAWISAGADVLAAEAIMHCKVDAVKRVICNGKRAMIVGGKIRAGEEVNAKTLGSTASTPTEIEVGINPNVRQELSDLEEERRNATDNRQKLAMNVNTLVVQRQNMGGVLPPEKAEMLGKMQASRGEIETRLKAVETKIGELRAYLNMLEAKGKICASNVVFPGCKVVVKSAALEVREEFKYVTFVQEAGNIRIVPYEEPTIEAKQMTRLHR
jgi:hypothetical protein